MTRICRKCGYWINNIPDLGGWVDEEDDTECYDADTLTTTGEHAPL